jgi:hypothetical protein
MTDTEFILYLFLGLSLFTNVVLVFLLQGESKRDNDGFDKLWNKHVELEQCNKQLEICKHDLTLP